MKLSLIARAASTIGSASVRAMKPSRIRATKAAITLTPNAVKRIKQLVGETEGSTGVKIGVKERGCNGLSYTLTHIDDVQRFDEVVLQDGVKVVIDSRAQLSLLGSEMDYVEDKLASEFVFNNPNIKGTCGCGESFHI